MRSHLSEARDSLWWVAAPPGVWALHFVVCYGTAAVWCAKYAGPASSLRGARWVIAGATLLALGALAIVARRGVAQQRVSRRSLEAEAADSPEARHHFMGITLVSLAALSALAIVFEALAAVFIGSCH